MIKNYVLWAWLWVHCFTVWGMQLICVDYTVLRSKGNTVHLANTAHLQPLKQADRCTMCDWICQKGSCKHTISSLTFQRHSIDTTID